MAIQLGDNIKLGLALPTDARYYSTTTNKPWIDENDVNTNLLGGAGGVRYTGLTVNIAGVEYWYKEGIANGDLIIKSMGGGGTLTGATNGIQLVNSGTSVSLGGLLTQPTIFTGSTTNHLKYNGDYSLGYTDRSIPDKQYVDTVALGLQIHAAVKVATTVSDGNIVLSGSPKTIDGISVTNGNRVLIKNQTSGSTNGIYIVTGGTWSRSDDYNFNPPSEISNGDLIPVVTGNTNRNTLWVLATQDPIVSGDSLNFTLFSNPPSNYIAGQGIDISGTTIKINDPSYAVITTALTGTTGSYLGTSGRNVCLNSSALSTLNGALTGATNGLSLSGKNVKLGGSLTGDTVIDTNGGNLSITGGTITNIKTSNINLVATVNSSFLCFNYGGGGGTTGLINCNFGLNLGHSVSGVDYAILNIQRNYTTFTDTCSTTPGIQYSADYSANYTSRSLVDAAYVTGKTSTIAADNGLCNYAGVIGLGGNLTGNTFIDPAGYNFNMCDTTTNSGICIDNSCVARLFAGDSSSCLVSLSVYSCHIEAITNNPSIFKGFTYQNGFTTDVGDIKSCSIPDVAYVTGLTTTASNGLTKDGNDIQLGGALVGSGATVITLNPSGGNLVVSGASATGVPYGICVTRYNGEEILPRVSFGSLQSTGYSANTITVDEGGMNWNMGSWGGSNTVRSCGNLRTDGNILFTSVSGSSLAFGSIESDLDFVRLYAGCGSFILPNYRRAEMRLCDGQIKVCGCNKTAPNGFAGIQYCYNYSSGFTSRSLVDKEYVDTCANIVGVKNVTSGYTATSVDNFIGVSGTSCVYLMSTPTLGQRVSIADICGNALSVPIEINGNGHNIVDGLCSTINTNYGSMTFIYNGYFWSAVSYIL